MKNIFKKILPLLALVLMFGCESEKEYPVIYMIGDSTMANKSMGPEKFERGWGQMLPLFLDSMVVVDNHAVNGRSSKSFRDEERWDPIMEKMKPGDYVIIQFGHNDEKADKPKLYTDSETSFRDNLRRYITETREKGGIPILATSIARRHFDEEGKLIDTHGGYIGAVFVVGEEMDVPVIDMNKTTTALINSMAQEESKKFFMWIPAGVYESIPNGKQDNTHLNVYGGKVVAKLAIDEIAEKVPALAKYVLKDTEVNKEVADDVARAGK